MKIESGSDLVLNLDLGVNLDDIVALEVNVFTTDKNQCITYKAEDIEGNSIYISASKLATLDSGVISYTYNYALPDDNFADAKYNKIGTKHTDYYFVNTGLVPEPDEYDYTYRFKFFP
ncbi:MAG: hypothetical protein HUJ56_11575 [Erysipelotrichaceae bacterium]|nr:hypothetical protein [Erysipelotrichaceae bacterium]